MSKNSINPPTSNLANDIIKSINSDFDGLVYNNLETKEVEKTFSKLNQLNTTQVDIESRWLDIEDKLA